MLIVHPSSQTTAGVWIAQEPLLVLDVDAPSSEKGRALRDSLAASVSNVPHPRSWAHHFDRFLEVADVKNWRAFVKNTRSVGVEDDGVSLILTPSRNQGARDGFTELLDRARQLPADASDEELGKALDAALDSSE